MTPDDDLVQPIAAARAGTHAEVVTAVALASVLAMVEAPDDPAWEEWLSHRWTKTVRRGTGPQLLAAEPFAASVVAVGDARAYGFVPCTYAELPAPLVKMQVAHFERERAGDLPDPGSGPVLSVNPSVEMSTGKTAAQVAHGVHRWWLARTPGARAAWLDAGHPLHVLTDPEPQAWRRLVREADATVQDAGLTEVVRGSVTVAVRHR